MLRPVYAQDLALALHVECLQHHMKLRATRPLIILTDTAWLLHILCNHVFSYWTERYTSVFTYFALSFSALILFVGWQEVLLRYCHSNLLLRSDPTQNCPWRIGRLYKSRVNMCVKCIYFVWLTCWVSAGSLAYGALLSSSRYSSSCCCAATNVCAAGPTGVTGIPGTEPYAATDRWTAFDGFPAATSGSTGQAQ